MRGNARLVNLGEEMIETNGWEGLAADHNFITSHVSDVEMRRNSGCDFFLSLSLSFAAAISLSLSLSTGREAISVTTFHVQF